MRCVISDDHELAWTGQAGDPGDPKNLPHGNLLAAVLKLRPRAEWIETLEAAKVPCGPINDLADVFADPQVLAREMTVQMPHPLAGTLRLVASPMKFSATPVQYRRPPPLLGEHTAQVLVELGLSADDITALQAARVV